MRGFWKRGEEPADWPEPRAEFLQSLSDEVRSARGRIRAGGLRLALVLAAGLALLVPLTAVAGGSATSSVRSAVNAVVSVVTADTGSNASGRRGNDAGDNYDCPNYGDRRSALAHHQNQEREALRLHQNQPHPGLSQSQRQRHFKEERQALHEHQKAEREQLKRECGKGNDTDGD